MTVFNEIRKKVLLIDEPLSRYAKLKALLNAEGILIDFSISDSTKKGLNPIILRLLTMFVYISEEEDCRSFIFPENTKEKNALFDEYSHGSQPNIDKLVESLRIEFLEDGQYEGIYWRPLLYILIIRIGNHSYLNKHIDE